MTLEEFNELVKKNPKAQYVINGEDFSCYVENITDELIAYKKAYYLLTKKVANYNHDLCGCINCECCWFYFNKHCKDRAGISKEFLEKARKQNDD